MYLGGTDAAAVNRLIDFVLEYPSKPSAVRVERRGRGEFRFEFVGTCVPLAARAGTTEPYLVETMSKLHPPDWWTSLEPRYGVLLARAYSARLEVTSVCGGRMGRIVSAHGEIVQPLVVSDVDLPDSFRVHMEVDPEIFDADALDALALKTVAQEFADRRHVKVELEG
jgi:hypothetical protein